MEFFSSGMTSERGLCSVLFLPGGSRDLTPCELRQTEIPPDFPRTGDTGIIEFLTLLQIINTL